MLQDFPALYQQRNV